MPKSNRSRPQSEEMILSLEIEKSKLNREKSLLLLDKSLLLYFAFVIIAVVGLINKYISTKDMNMLIILSFGVLAVGLVPYMITMGKEERKLNMLIDRYQNGGRSRKS